MTVSLLFPGCFLFGAGHRRAGKITVQRYQVSLAFVVLVLASASMSLAAGIGGSALLSHQAAVSGIVRDAQGVAQMGAMIQVVAADSATSATAFTDLHGRYLVANLLPGKYLVRASAALFVPALRENLQLRAGGRSVVNLTLSTLFDTTSWLPAERRKADEPGDDWKWTLRSVANRPILRMVEDGEIVLISSSATESPRPSDLGKASMSTGDGTFGRGGTHDTFTVDRGLAGGADVRLRVDLGAGGAVPGRGFVPGRPSTEVQAGYQLRLGAGGAARTVVSYQSHPEMAGSSGVTGMEAMQVASAQKMQIGDFADVEAGSTLTLIHSSSSLVAARPFLRVTAHPIAGWTVGYRMATSRDFQAFNALDSIQPELPVSVTSDRGMRTERGLHHELSVSHKAGMGMIQASYYHDALDGVLVSGGGGLAAADLDESRGNRAQFGGVIADTATDSFRVLASGYRTQGINVILTEPLTIGLWAAVQYENGSALSSGRYGSVTLPSVASELKSRSAQSATAALKGRVLRSGTSVRAAYRWQPVDLVSAVDPYAAFSDQAYLSFLVRQPVNCGHWLPAGLEATVDVTNLLAQGYRPFLSADGRTLYLAQAPRSIQAGLAFNF